MLGRLRSRLGARRALAHSGWPRATIVGAKLLLRLVSDHVRGNPFDAEPEIFDGTARRQEVSISGALRCWREPLAERAQVAAALDR